MDVDHEEEPVSPSTSSSPSLAPGPFLTPNGVDHAKNDNVNGDGSPVPPPHRAPPAEPQPPPKPTIDAEACKAAGNKFFKMGDYDKAIKEYSKGVLMTTCFQASTHAGCANTMFCSN